MNCILKKNPNEQSKPKPWLIEPLYSFCSILKKNLIFLKHVFPLNCLFYKQWVLVEPWAHQAKGGSAVSSSSPHRSPRGFFSSGMNCPLWARCAFLLTGDECFHSWAVLLTALRFLESLLTPRCEVDSLWPGADKQPQDFVAASPSIGNLLIRREISCPDCFFLSCSAVSFLCLSAIWFS